MHLLPFEDVDQLHLLLEGLHELISLPLQLPVIFNKLLHVLALSVGSALLDSSSFSQLHLHFFKLFKSTVQLRIFRACILSLLPLFPFDLVDLSILLLELGLKVVDFLHELGVRLL